MKEFMRKKGFTLIEMMVAMGIFVMFIGILISSYTDIVRSNIEANDYRMLYSESRRVFDKLSEEIRKGSIYYNTDPDFPTNPEYIGPMNSLRLISEGGNRDVTFSLKPAEVVEGVADDDIKWNIFLKEDVFDPLSQSSYPLTGFSEGKGVYVKEFSVFVSPAGDPYNPNNVFADGLQFQPKVTVFATFGMERRRGGEPYTLDLQTTISSRFYTQALTSFLSAENYE